MKFQYFRSVEGRVLSRYGTDTFIGVAWSEGKHVWDTKRVVAIPETEYIRHLKAYTRAVKVGDIKKATKKEYDDRINEEKAKAEREAKAATDKNKNGNKKGSAGRGSTKSKGG